MSRETIFASQDESGETEITDMHNHVLIEKDIARLEIAVNYWDLTVMMKILQSTSIIDGNIQSLG